MIPLVQNKDIVVRWVNANPRDPTQFHDKCTAFFHREETVHADTYLRGQNPWVTEKAEEMVRLKVRRKLYPVELVRELKELRYRADELLRQARGNQYDASLLRERFSLLIDQLQSGTPPSKS